MRCWHCDNELDFNLQTAEAMKLYHCQMCDKWYELRKEKARINGAVPMRFFELDACPPLYKTAMAASA